jgi:hypothetical protein
VVRLAFALACTGCLSTPVRPLDGDDAHPADAHRTTFDGRAGTPLLDFPGGTDAPDGHPSGLAEVSSFRYTGTGESVTTLGAEIAKPSAMKPNHVQIALYSNSFGDPRGFPDTLLGTTTISQPVDGWNEDVFVSATGQTVTLTPSSIYWIAVAAFLHDGCLDDGSTTCDVIYYQWLTTGPTGSDDTCTVSLASVDDGCSLHNSDTTLTAWPAQWDSIGNTRFAHSINAFRATHYDP